MSGAVSGAVAGFAGGLITGTGNAMAFQGANMGGALVSGLKAGGIGAAIGGVVGGFSKGIEAAADGRNFWSGAGTHDILAPAGGAGEVKVGEGMEYSTKYAKSFSDENFGDIKGVKQLYADGSTPNGYKIEGDRVYNKLGSEVLGSTQNLAGQRMSLVYLYKAAFVSKEQLYLTMGHEYLHAMYYNAGLIANDNVQHAAIYEWQYKQSELWNYNLKEALRQMNNYGGNYNPAYSSTNFGFYPINTRP